LSPGDPTISVVIATRDRRELLERVVGQLLDQLGGGDELIVVDDSTSAHGLGELLDGRVCVLRSGGRGPATARNLGWRACQGDVIAFTDDDVQVDANWLATIRTEFATRADLIAIEGRTVSRPFDPLYEYSVDSDDAVNGLTCNVAYRSGALEQIGGFDEDFRFAHCEDVDLFIRARGVGRVEFSEHMLVEHEPRPVIPAQFARRAGWLASERRLYSKHRERRPYPLPPALCALITYVRWPIDYLIVGTAASSLRDAARLRRTALLTALWWWHVAKAVPSLVSGS
jgi:glycosyltransferase involved in cell wall biosynthesis